jgi:hypothetical protein
MDLLMMRPVATPASKLSVEDMLAVLRSNAYMGLTNWRLENGQAVADYPGGQALVSLPLAYDAADALLKYQRSI